MRQLRCYDTNCKICTVSQRHGRSGLQLSEDECIFVVAARISASLRPSYPSDLLKPYIPPHLLPVLSVPLKRNGCRTFPYSIEVVCVSFSLVYFLSFLFSYFNSTSKTIRWYSLCKPCDLVSHVHHKMAVWS